MQRGFVITETRSRFADDSERWFRPGYDLDCSMGYGNGARLEDAAIPAACTTTLFGASPPGDSEQGVDNSFLRTFMPELARMSGIEPLDLSTASDRWRMIVTLTQYNGEMYDSAVHVSLLYADRWEDAGGIASDGTSVDVTRRWGIEGEHSYLPGARPKFRDPEAYVSDYQVVARLTQPDGTPGMTLKLFAPDREGEARSIAVSLMNPTLTFVLTHADGRLTGLRDGILSGIWYEPQWPDTVAEYESARSSVAGAGGGSGGNGGAGGRTLGGLAAAGDAAGVLSGGAVAGAVPSPSSTGRAGVESSGLDEGVDAPSSDLTEGTLIPFADSLGLGVVLPAFAAALDMHLRMDLDDDATVCNSISLAIGLRGEQVEFTCPSDLTRAQASGGAGNDSMAGYSVCRLVEESTRK